MAGSKPKPPTGAVTNNGWYLTLFSNPQLVSPHFNTLSGLSKKTGTIEIVDGGTNIKYKFSSQIIDFGQITLSRPNDASPDDAAWRGIVNAGIRLGVKYTGVLIKEHFSQEVYRIAFSGLGFKEYNYPDFNVSAEDAQMPTVMATVDSWEETL